jgi:hypothetical protein
MTNRLPEEIEANWKVDSLRLIHPTLFKILSRTKVELTLGYLSGNSG